MLYNVHDDKDTNDMIAHDVVQMIVRGTNNGRMMCNNGMVVRYKS